MASVLRSSSLTTARAPYAPLHLRAVPDVRSPQAPAIRDGDCLGVRIAHSVAAEERTFAAGHEIYAEGEPAHDVYVVLEGWVMLYHILENGRRQILNFALPGTILGLGATAEAEMRHTAEGLTDVKIAVLPRRRLGELFVREPKLVMQFVEAMTSVLESAYESLTDAGSRTSRDAVAHLLLRLARRVRARQPRSAGLVVELPLRLEHIGDALGLTTVHVCRSLRSLRENGIVAFHKGGLRIQNAARLAAAAGAQADEIGTSPRLGMGNQTSLRREYSA